MTINPFVERYQDQIADVLNCFDRVVITGTLPEICHAEANKAQTLADSLEAKQLHRRLDRWVKRFCPIVHHVRANYHWNFMQVEYATDGLLHR
jgi:hypothetical protein